jgi:DNA-directed RNA polymerase subunit RPC12/RpoP
MPKLKEPESMEECEYFSRRALESGHKLVVWVSKETPTVMNISYICAKCKHEDSVTDTYSLPYMLTCQKCGEKIKVEPLKGKKRGLKK